MEFVKEQQKLERKAGEEISIGKIDDFGDQMSRDKYIMTGVLGIDLNICGIQRYAMHIFYGNPSSGKTTAALEIISGIQFTEPDAAILYVDSEQAVDESYLNRFPMLNTKNIILKKTNMLEKMIDDIYDMMDRELLDYVIIDSVDSSLTKSETEKELENGPTMMSKARVLSWGCAKLNSLTKKRKVTLMLIQQVRNITKGQFVVEGKSGGKALDYYTSTILKFAEDKKKLEFAGGDKDNVLTRGTEIKNEKSKVSQALKRTNTFINTDPAKRTAIDRIKETISYGEELGLLERSGAYYKIIDPTTGAYLEENGTIVNIQGATKVQVYLKENLNTYSLLKLAIYSKGIPKEMFVLKFEEIKHMLEAENAKMKQIKIDLCLASGRTHLITDKDKEELDLTNYKITDYLSKEDYEEAKYILATDEEKDRIIEEKLKDTPEFDYSSIKVSEAEDILNQELEPVGA